MDNRSIFRKFADWLLAGGVMKTIGRVITLVGIIVALVITAIGVVEMYQAAEADRQVAFDKAYVKQQKKEYKAKQKENDAAIKEGKEPPHVLPENQEDYVVEEVPVVKLSLDDHIGPFLTKYFVWAVVALAAGVFIGWVIGNIPLWLAAMKAAGPVAVIAGALFWLGAVIAACFLLAGLWEILQINKSTLPEVGKILMEKYAIWSVIALGLGIALRWLILNLVKTQRKAYESVGAKLRVISKAIFYVTLCIFPLVVIGAACAAVFSKWALALGVLAGAVALLGAGWLLSLCLEALGTCSLIMAPQVQEAEAREHAYRHATTWICPVCGLEHANSVGACPECGAVRPKK